MGAETTPTLDAFGHQIDIGNTVVYAGRGTDGKITQNKGSVSKLGDGKVCVRRYVRRDSGESVSSR